MIHEVQYHWKNWFLEAEVLGLVQNKEGMYLEAEQSLVKTLQQIISEVFPFLSDTIFTSVVLFSLPVSLSLLKTPNVISMNQFQRNCKFSNIISKALYF